MKNSVLIFLAALLLSWAQPAHAGVSSTTAIDAVLAKYEQAGKAWEQPMKQAATGLFASLALIGFLWMGISHMIQQELKSFLADLVRFIILTGVFFFLLQHGPEIASTIISGAWQLASGMDGLPNGLTPTTFINLSIRAYQKATAHLSIFAWDATATCLIFGIIVLALGCILSANVILVLASCWILIYAGIIYLGFGGAFFTRDMAIGYFRHCLHEAIRAMVMALIMGIAVKFLTDQVNTISDVSNAGDLIVLSCCLGILCFLSHKIPLMVAQVAFGGGGGGSMGGISAFTSMMFITQALNRIARNMSNGSRSPSSSSGNAVPRPLYPMHP